MRKRFVLAISLLVALIVALQAGVLLLGGHGFLRADVEDNARSFAALATPRLVDVFETYASSGFQKLVQQVGDFGDLVVDLEHVELYETSGTLLFAAEFDRSDGDSRRPVVDRERVGDVQISPRLQAAVRGLDQVVWRDRSGPALHFVVVQPFVDPWGQHRYTAVYRHSYRRLDAGLLAMGWRLVALGGLALLLGVACAAMLAGQNLRPLERLTDAARQLAAGRLETRVALRTQDEFGVLATTLDRMAARLETVMGDLESSNTRLERANRELKDLDRVKSDLLANVSHELRTPLTAIGGYVEALGAGLLGDVDADQADALAVVERNVHRLRAMIDQLLSYSRLDAGHMELEHRPFDLAAVARQVVDAVDAARGAAGGEVGRLRLDIEPDLPNVRGDAGAISEVLDNLLTNALKFSPEDRSVEVRIEALEPSGTAPEVRVAVRDHGVGIANADQTRIFERFFQVDASSRRAFGGMGLGLAIVREILQLHESDIELESAPNAGSTFAFRLPAVLAASQPSGIMRRLGTRRLLLIDDDGRFTARVGSALEDRGWQVDVAATAERGSSLARKTVPDLVVLDRLLPDLDGFDLLERWRDDPELKHLSVVLCTVRPERALGRR
ncbi:MAG: ATP-binding protein, partial [Acidobacteriota bacterium]